MSFRGMRHYASRRTFLCRTFLRRTLCRGFPYRRFFTVLTLAICCPILLSGGGGRQDGNPSRSLPSALPPAEAPAPRTAPAAEPLPPAVESEQPSASPFASPSAMLSAQPSALPAASPEAEARFVLIPEDIRPGEPLTVVMVSGTSLAGSLADGKADGSVGLRAVLINGQGRRLARAAFFGLGTDFTPGTESAAAAAGETGGPLLAAILGVPSTAKPGPAGIRVERGTEPVGEIPIHIGGRDFVSEEIALDEENTAIRRTPDREKTREAERLWAILNRSGARIYTTAPFIPPVSSTRRTSFFGDRRVYRYPDGKSDTAIHGGVDYGVPRGTPVGACADGRVILARFRIVTGNSVIIEHLPGVYSLYYHLDTIRATEGSLVGAGEVLGESGSTGLATGPHLHWEIRVSGENTDPDAFLVRPVLDKDAIFGKIQR